MGEKEFTEEQIVRILHKPEPPTNKMAARPHIILIIVKCVKALVESMLLKGSTNAEWANACLKQYLFKELSPPSTFLNG
jgi:hypothetical protein